MITDTNRLAEKAVSLILVQLPEFQVDLMKLGLMPIPDDIKEQLSTVMRIYQRLESGEDVKVDGIIAEIESSTLSLSSKEILTDEVVASFKTDEDDIFLPDELFFD